MRWESASTSPLRCGIASEVGGRCGLPRLPPPRRRHHRCPPLPLPLPLWKPTRTTPSRAMHGRWACSCLSFSLAFLRLTSRRAKPTLREATRRSSAEKLSGSSRSGVRSACLRRSTVSLPWLSISSSACSASIPTVERASRTCYGTRLWQVLTCRRCGNHRLSCDTRHPWRNVRQLPRQRSRPGSYSGVAAEQRLRRVDRLRRRQRDLRRQRHLDFQTRSTS